MKKRRCWLYKRLVSTGESPAESRLSALVRPDQADGRTGSEPILDQRFQGAWNHDLHYRIAFLFCKFIRVGHS